MRTRTQNDIEWVEADGQYGEIPVKRQFQRQNFKGIKNVKT